MPPRDHYAYIALGQWTDVVTIGIGLGIGLGIGPDIGPPTQPALHRTGQPQGGHTGVTVVDHRGTGAPGVSAVSTGGEAGHGTSPFIGHAGSSA